MKYVLTAVLASKQLIADIVGTTLAGTESVNVQVFVPVTVLFTMVLQVIVHTPVVALGIWDANDSGGVHDTDAPTEVALVPVALPKE